MGLRSKGLGSRQWFQVYFTTDSGVLGFRVQGSGFRVQGLGLARVGV